MHAARVQVYIIQKFMLYFVLFMGMYKMNGWQVVLKTKMGMRNIFIEIRGFQIKFDYTIRIV